MSTETLRPNAAGDSTALTPNTGANYECVDEETPDETGTYVYRGAAGGFARDLYNLPAHSGTGTINFIKVYVRCNKSGASTQYCWASIKSDSTITDGTQETLTTSFVTYSEQWDTNPADSAAWEWSDIDALQIGVKLQAATGSNYARCTQVYVEIDYTPSGASSIPAIMDFYKQLRRN